MESAIKGGLLRHLIVVSVKGKTIFNFPMESAIKEGLLRHPIVVLVKRKIVMIPFTRTHLAKQAIH